MTNPKIQRKDVISDEEFKWMLERVEEADYPFEYYRMRDKAILCILRRTGKRRREVASLEISDLAVKGRYLSITFTVRKKRRKNILSLQREKLLSLKDPLVQPILEYWSWMKKNNPECRYLFPRTFYSPLTKTFTLDRNHHLSGRQILRIVKRANPRAWCHLFRETVGAEIVRKDPSIMAPFKVMRRLDLESYTTAFNYMKRYAADIIEYEGKEDAVIDVLTVKERKQLATQAPILPRNA